MQTPLIDKCIALATENRAVAEAGGTATATGADRRRSERQAAPQPAWVSGDSNDRSSVAATSW